MIAFVDTSALFALLARDDAMHDRASAIFGRLAGEGARLVTSSFVLAEIAALLDRRIGPQAVHDFHSRLMPLLDVVWVDEAWYARGVHRFSARGASRPSLVDCLSFEIMEGTEIRDAFAFDRHFEEGGFRVLA